MYQDMTKIIDAKRCHWNSYANKIAINSRTNLSLARQRVHPAVLPSSLLCSMVFMNSRPLWISKLIMHPVWEQAVHLNSVPRGSGFLGIWVMFGNPPVAVVRGLHALMHSSIQRWFDGISSSKRFLLNSSTALMNSHHGSVFQLYVFVGMR